MKSMEKSQKFIFSSHNIIEDGLFWLVTYQNDFLFTETSKSDENNV